jgi:cholesterol oxidase
MKENINYDFDYIIIGSGFGGSVSALRLSEKGYKVLVLEKGRWYKNEDFPKSNWNLRKWLWIPFLKCFGFFKITFFKHVATLTGVGVGGGSLVYANALPIPSNKYFTADSWGHLADWKNELKPYYKIALKMMGATINPKLSYGDEKLKELAKDLGIENQYSATNVAVYFGEPEKTVLDPYFNGEGPNRAGCNLCSGCMVGCRYNAKNTLDKNYLYFAQKYGTKIQTESEVYDVYPNKNGYIVKWKTSTKLFKKRGKFSCKGIIFAGGALGTVKLLLKLKNSSLPKLSPKTGTNIRTNSESLIGITVADKQTDFSEGVAIGAILNTDEHSHLETVNYPAGSGFWRLAMSPFAHGNNVFIRILKVLGNFIFHPVKNFRSYFVDDWAKRTQILMLMQTIDSTLRFSRGLIRMKSTLSKGKKPTSFIPEAEMLAKNYAAKVKGKPTMLLSETILGIPTTAHILGGAVMGKDSSEGVINKDNKVFGYHNMYVCDGSMISANPGVNPSLSILALSERAMSKIPENNKSV